jgi:acetyl esterase/lipase
MKRRNMRTKLGFLFISAVAGVFSAQSPSPASGAAARQEPRAYVYREIDGQKLQAFVFAPQGAASGKPTAAVLLFHGGGWVTGSADWTFDEARRFAALGLAAVAIDYRLSAGKVTPIESLDDTRAAFRWVRRHAAEFNLDPKRVAGYGVSAGGQLVAAAGVLDLPGDGIDGTSSKPDLLLLWSPVLDIADVEYYAKLLQGRGRNLDYSPVQHAGASTPPTCIVHGEKDAFVSLREVEGFRDRVVAAGGVCALNVYPGVGHLLTRNIADQLGELDPDPKFQADGTARLIDFLKTRGFIY